MLLKLYPSPALLAANFHTQLLDEGHIIAQIVMGEQNKDAYEEVHVAILNRRANVGKALN